MKNSATVFSFIVLFSLLVTPAVSTSIVNKKPQDCGFIDCYGNWCGGGHGGYEDCCGDQPCPACLKNLKHLDCYNSSECDPGTPSTHCLLECPPIDDLDLACAYHDLCTYQFIAD